MERFTLFSVSVIFIFFSFFQKGYSSGSFKNINEDFTIDQLIEIVEEKHSVTVFYQPQWFEEVLFSSAIAELSLHSITEEVTSKVGLEVIFIDDVIVFVPTERVLEERLAYEDDYIIIGDPNQFGRYSRATITGSVLDGATDEPLIGAVIYDPESQTGVTTDVDGNFSLELPVGQYSLRISYTGYEEIYQDIQLISDGRVTFDLFSEITELDEVTIVAMRAEDNIMRTQMSLVSMDSKVLSELPSTFGEQDIVRSMTLLPGVQSVGEFGTGFNVRGGGADQNLILVENVPLFNSSHLFGFISVINPEMVSNVTLMKAGIPAKYGERASSVMDIRLNSRLDKEKPSIRGGIGLINSRLLFETPIVQDRASFSFGARSTYSDWLLREMPDEDLMNSTARFHDFTAMSNIMINLDNYLTIFGYYSFDKFGFREENIFEYSNALASLRWNRIIGKTLSSTMIFGWSNYNYQVAEKPAINPLVHSKMKSEIDYKSFRYFFSYQPFHNHSVEFGVNAINYNISPGDMFPLGDESAIDRKTMDDEQALELSAFVSDDILIGDRMSLELGLRFTQYLQLGPATVNIYEPDLPMSEENLIEQRSYDSNQIVSKYNGLEPRFGFRYKTGESSSVKLSYNRINQYINLISNTSVMSPADLWKLSDQHIKPLISDQYAIGYFQNFRNNTIETSLEVYYRDFKNSIEYKSGAEIVMNDFLEADVINAKGYGYGLELFIRKNVGRLTGWTSYTYSSSMRRSQEQFAENKINRNNYFPSNYDRPHNLVINLNYDISRRWRFGTVFTYSTGRPVTLPELVYSYGSDYLIYYSDRNKYRLPAYHRLDISLTLGENLRVDQTGKGSWTFSLMNVYGRKNPYSVFYKRDPHTIDSHRSFNLYQLYIIGRPLPTITYNYSF